MQKECSKEVSQVKIEGHKVVKSCRARILTVSEASWKIPNLKESRVVLW